jgi:hypothetical protein
MVIKQIGTGCYFFCRNRRINSTAYSLNRDLQEYNSIIIQELNKILCTLTLK